MDVRVKSLRALGYFSLVFPLLVCSSGEAIAGSTYKLNLDGTFIQTFAALGYNVYVRQSCQPKAGGSYSHNNSDPQLVQFDKSQYHLSTARCKKQGATTRQVQSVEVKFTKKDGRTHKCTIRMKEADRASSVHKEYDIGQSTCNGKDFAENFISNADDTLSSQLNISNEVINKFAPTTYLCDANKNEIVEADARPFSVESFLSYVDYYDEQNAKYTSPVTPEYLEGKKGSLQSKGVESLHGASDLNQAPYYVRVKAYSVPDKPGVSVGFVDLQYWSFYGLSGSQLFRVGGKIIENTNFVWNNFARHEGDWEHVTVRVNDSFDKILGVYFSGHGGGHWVAPSNMHYHEEHPVVYSACHSHAANERPEIFGETPIANKFTIPSDDLGITIEPYEIPGSGDFNLGAACGVWLKTIDLGSDSSVQWAPWENENMLIRIDQSSAPKWVEYEGTYGPTETENDVKAIDDSVVNGDVAGCLFAMVDANKSKLENYIKVGSPQGPKFQKSWNKPE
ncbi:MAG: Vps62-related protein [Gammaproteobacteria bacterium]|nr:Vps62-related protein [Gammaproteobacteria bacterium]